jgi:hypothetical protein
MKILSFLFLIGCLSLASCKKCKNEDPRARVVNNGTKNISVQIQTSGGNTVNINNIDAGQTSEYKNFAEGNVTFTISVGNGNNTENYTKTVAMETCYEYDIVLDQSNTIVSIPTDRND